MRVLELSLRNYRVFEELDLELPARVIGIFGENGSGKSTLVESIAFACYGAEAARTKRQEIRTHGVLADCLVRLAFEHAGQQYEVRRAIKGRGHAPEAELFVGSRPFASGTTEVNEEIARILHMDLHVFRASVYAEQGELDAFSDLRRGERVEMALRLLGIKPVDDARTAARREARATKENAAQLQGAVPDLAALEADLKDAGEAATEGKRVVKVAQEARKAATKRSKAVADAFRVIDQARERVERLGALLAEKVERRDERLAERDELAERVERLAVELEAMPALGSELAELGNADERLRIGMRFVEAADELQAVESRLAALPAIDAESALETLERAKAEHDQAQAAAADAQAERNQRTSALAEAQARLDRAAEADPTQPCPTCGRPLEDFAAYVKHCKAEVASAKRAAADASASAKRAQAALAKVTKALDAAASAAESARRAEEQRTRLTEQVDAMRTDLAPLAEPFDGTPPDVDELRAGAERARSLGERIAELGAQRDFAAQLQNDLSAADARLAALEDELTKLTDEASAISFEPAEHARVSDDLQRAEEALEEAREVERTADDELQRAELARSELAGALGQAKDIASRVEDLRSDARYVERVAMLLDGFRDHLVARVGPELSREAEALFRELTNHEYDDLRVDEESLEIRIADGDAYFPIDRFSGSETDLANLALRVAISTHLSHVSGADVGLMVLDEVLGSLDEERKDLMIRALGMLAGRFHQLFVITHAERIKDQFPASIVVQKSGRRRSTAGLV
ncbi:MAG: SMC family ATPase [Actinobacteria bacterium]|nr:SMC family ATPase [Actinomycetota bacterium]